MKKQLNGRTILINYLTTTYPQIWKSSNPAILTNIGLATLDFLLEKIDEAIQITGIQSYSRPIPHKPVFSIGEKKVNGIIGRKSSKHFSIELDLNGKRYFIKHSSGSSINGMETSSKENLLIFFAHNRSEYRPIKTSFNKNFIDDNMSLMKRMLNDMKNNGIKGMPTCSLEELMIELTNEIQNENIDTNKNFLKSILNHMAGGNSLTNSGLITEKTLYRDKPLKMVRDMLSIVYGIKRIDNCFPIDILGVQNGFDLQQNITNIFNESNKEEKINMINLLFVDMNDTSTFNRPLLGISLKQEKARGGKGKDAVGKDGNISKEEMNLSYEDKKILVLYYRQKFNNIALPNIKYNMIGSIDKFENKDTITNKLAALKLTHYVIEKYMCDKKTLEDIVNVCAGLGLNPSYIKMKLDEKGNDKNVEYVKYKAGDRIKISDYCPIEIRDKNSSSLIDIIFNIEHNNEISQAKLELRTNGSAQCMVELIYI